MSRKYISNIKKDIAEKNVSEQESIRNIEKKKNSIINELNWYIEISCINLKAPIEETTDMDILNNYIGHFEDTPRIEGNIGLAGHNRGYNKNYFEKLNLLKIGNEIKYIYYDYQKEYIIDKIEVIKNTNWSYLENTKENKLTLITCIENKPENRLCIQATEK